MWVAQSYPFARSDRWLTSGGLGTMGFGLPAAIGAALAEPEATVVCFTGDGSLLMNIQELATLAELRANIKIVLFDNGGFGLVRQQQSLFYRQRYSACAFDAPSDFRAIANAFGIQSVEFHDIESTLQSRLTARGPLLIRVRIDANAMVLPMVAPGAANVEALC
jgi:acetolactate synthase-1/2/3 large subunit